MTNDELRDLVDRATPDTPPAFDDVLDRRGRRARRRRATAVVGGAAAIAVIVAGTAWLRSGDAGHVGTGPAVAPGGSSTVSPSPTSTAPSEPPDWDGKGVPPLTLMLDDRMVVLASWSYCYGNACADGMPPEHLDDVGSPETVEFAFPVPGWDFEVTFTPPRDKRSHTVQATPTSPTTFEITPPKDPGPYTVNLFGTGDGDVSFTFGWTVPGRELR
jgi:hypothetical protein